MDKSLLQPLSGFRDDLPAQMIPKRRMLGTIERVFESFGYAPLDTPALERSAVLLGKYGDEGDKLLYKFEDNGGRSVALRYDLTVPLARVVAAHPELTMPFRRYQVAKVWRAEKAGRGRFREFVQCDVDIIGARSLMADAECVQVICAVLDALGVDGYRVFVNNRKLLNSLLAHFGVEGTERVHGSLRLLDKLDKIERDRVRALLVSEAGWTETDAGTFLELVHGGLEGAASVLPDDDEGLVELAELLSLCEAAGVSDRVTVNLSIARGLDYYTGTIYETFLTELPGFGSVMSGGRYDALLRDLCRRDLPAVGVSLGISRLFAGLVELGLVEEPKGVAQVVVAMFDRDTVAHSYACAASLREAGISVEVFPGKAKLGKQFQHADRRGALAVCLVGSDEAAAGQVRVKWLRSGEQQTIDVDKLVAHVLNGLEA